MKKILTIVLALFSSICLAQNDSIVFNFGSAHLIMIKVKGGTYRRGCNPKTEDDTLCRKYNRYEHIVELKTFYISKYEVSQRLYYEITNKKPSYYKPQKSLGISFDGPVECVNWYDAVSFTDTLSKLTGKHFRLPTEAEWEYAARGGIYHENFQYAGSDDIDKVALYHHNEPNLRPVYYIWPQKCGLKLPNALGIYDMSGNVGEWCSDWFDPSYYQTQKYFKNPSGPKTGEKKVVRDGSSAYGFPAMLEVKSRKGKDPLKRHSLIGFRLAMDAE